jgi:predicted transcriptional regulator
MDLIEFGKRVLMVREEVLEMNQTELAEQLQVTQNLISRLETGVGGNINIIFEFLNFLKRRKLAAHMIFRDPFDIKLLSKSPRIKDSGENMLTTLIELKESASKDHEKIILLLDWLLEKK